MSVWELAYDGLDPAHEPLREALCTLGNGVFATRGAAVESTADGVHYPGTYAASGFNRLVTRVAGRDVENEDLVNLPSWLPLRWRPDGGTWADLARLEVLAHRQVLDLRAGVLHRDYRVRDGSGRVTAVAERRLVSMADPRLAAVELVITPDWDGGLELRAELDGRVRNAGVHRYRALRGQHLAVLVAGTGADGDLALTAATVQSHLRVGLAARLRVDGEVAAWTPEEGLGSAAATTVRTAAAGVPVTVEKVVALLHGRMPAVSDPGGDAANAVAGAPAFAELLARHTRAWAALWERYGLEVGDPDTAMIANLHTFHVLATVSEHTIPLDAGIPARGLHGEAYRGHVFWDELFVFPWLELRSPELARALLGYRARRLPAARAVANAEGLAGAMFPWQSGSSGREETQVVHLNPVSGRWLPDGSHLQRHVNHAIAWNTWQHWVATGDLDFLAGTGAPLLAEVARFLASAATLDPADGRWHLRGVMGPDEYHEGPPSRPASEVQASDGARPGLDDNTYTNVMTAWVLVRAGEALDALPAAARAPLGVDAGERRRWEEVSRGLAIPWHTGDDGRPVPSQFAGYERLDELDWEAYRARYGSIARLDRILEAEGDTTDRYRLSKQADLLMLPFLLDPAELRGLFERLGYAWEDDLLARTVDYYERRTTHGSTLSRVVHAVVLARIDPERSWAFFRDALHSDLRDTQGGTTAEGIHLGVMAGTLDVLQRRYAGLRLTPDGLSFDPALPPQLGHVTSRLRHRHVWGLQVRVTPDQLALTAPEFTGPPLRVAVRGTTHELRSGATLACDLS